jgi:hypothetical protein
VFSIERWTQSTSEKPVGVIADNVTRCSAGATSRHRRQPMRQSLRMAARIRGTTTAETATNTCMGETTQVLIGIVHHTAARAAS